MSYDIELVCPTCGQAAEAEEEHDIRGGTYCIGDNRLRLNVTYNYAPFFRMTLGERGIRAIYGLTAAESIPVLESAAARLTGEPDDDYWAALPGNARRAMEHLISLARLAPLHSVWRGD